ncbi:serine/threonine protein kinase [Mortierella sp. AM989]|nr:serine/threonine protein kinase [Mortierella sp. AM989]
MVVLADNHNQISSSPAKRTVAVSPLARSSQSSLEEEGNSDMPAIAPGAHIHHSSSRLVAASHLTQEPSEEDDNADVSSLEQASDYDNVSENSPSSTPKRQSSASSFSAIRPLQNSSSYYSQYSASNSSTHVNSSQLTRTNTESTDVLVSMPTSMEASRQNSDDDDDSHHHHRHLPHAAPHHYHNDPSSIQEWAQRRQNNAQPFQLQQPSKKPTQNETSAQLRRQDTDIKSLAEALENQKLECPGAASEDSCDICCDNEDSTPEVEHISGATSKPMSIPAPKAQVSAAVMASSAASNSSAFSPSLSGSPSSTVKKSSSFFSRRKDSKMSRKKSARETSHGIFHDLKRFLKVRSTSPTLSPSKVDGHVESISPKSKKSDSKSHHHHGSHGNCIETDLRKKYGKVGKIIGSGAGGTVRVICRESDKKSFAIKQFRKRKPNESERTYIKKLTSEYCLGSTFHHPNIIETLDIVQEADNYYEIMEFAKHELFTAVMSGAMGRDEIACCFKGVTNGVAYLHDMGVAHRDLKLDNIVMNERGIVKIIDFGCSMVYQHPFEKKIHLAKGISGSDPYIAPEVFITDEHDPRLADVWSLGIIYVCMTLRRFPWKLAKKDDASFESYSNSSLAGKNRLLKLMPRESRNILSRMLEVDPTKRALMTEVMEDSWVKGIEECTMETACLYHCHHLGEDPSQVWNPHPKPRFGGRTADAEDDDSIEVKAAPPVISSLINSQVPVSPVH